MPVPTAGAGNKAAINAGGLPHGQTRPQRNRSRQNLTADQDVIVIMLQRNTSYFSMRAPLVQLAATV
jgi:hypothetical protein